MTLLITGASGFLGAHALELAAARGLTVHAPSSKTLDLLDDLSVVRDRVAAIGATHLLHLAWYAAPGKFWTSEENYRWVGATMALAQGFADGGGRRIVAAGTCAEYDWSLGGGKCVEATTPCAPATPYGVAKDATRRLLESFTRQRGVGFAWGRIFFPYGPGEHPDRLVPSVVRSLLTGGKASVTEGLQERDFLHVRDAASAFVALLLSEVEGAVNVGTGEAVRVRDLVETIARELHGEERVLYGVLPMRENDPPLLVADARRLREEAGWTPRYDLASGVKDTIAYWKGFS